MPPKSTYTAEKASEIVEWISQGKTLRDFCRQDGAPGWVTVYRWIAEHADFAERFARARDLGADAIAEETIEIIDEKPATVVDDKGVTRIDSAHVSWTKNRVDQRMKLLAKWSPKKYGEKVAAEITGKDGAALVVEIVRFGNKDSASE